MIKTLPILRSACGSLCFVLAGYAYSQGKEQQIESAHADFRRPIQVSAIGDPMNRVGDPVFVTLSFKNTSTSEQIVKNFVIRIDPSAGGRFEGGGDCVLERLGEITLAVGDSYSQTCRFPVMSAIRTTAVASVGGTSEPHNSGESIQLTDGWVNRSWRDSLLSADLRLVADVNVQNVGKLKYFPVIQIKAGEFSVFIGGVVGAMLLALFVWAERLLKNPVVRERWVRNLFVTILMGFRGGLLSVIALLLGKTTQGIGSPVTLTVVDFAGGVLVGLFSYPLASWISSTLKLDGVFVPAGNQDSPLSTPTKQTDEATENAAKS